MRTLVAIAILCTSASAAPVPKELKKSPFGQFYGAWELISYNGEENSEVFTFEISEEWSSLTRSSGGKIVRYAYIVRLNSTNTPIQMTSAVDDKQEHYKTSIVKVEGDLLYECWSLSEAIPTTFSAKGGNQLYIYKRAR
jgi:hypothetical protein